MKARHMGRAAGIVVALALLAGCPKMITDSGYTLTVSPPAANLFVGDSTRLTATLRDAAGQVVVTSFAWSIDDAAVARIDANGMVKGVAPGSTGIRVMARGESATATLVVAPEEGRTLSVTPAAARLFLETTQRFTATLKDKSGKTIPSDPEWSSSNTSVASIDGNGVARGVGVGTATIQAKAGGLVAAAAVTVGDRPEAVTLVGAGDIATCTGGGDEATADLIAKIPDATVFTLGDNAYPNGTTADFQNCYGPSWGRFKPRTRPATGNHEYHTMNAAGYYAYFGAAAGDPTKGYYSYDLGGWHIIALNSSLNSSAGSPQEQWLRADLAANSLHCTLAYWHHPRFSSGAEHGNSLSMQPLWQALYDFGAEIVLSGHDHIYERFAPQTPTGQLDMNNGIREFVVGTGGAGLYAIGGIRPNSEVRHNSSRGVLKLTLHADRYEWQFIPTSGGFTDTGSASCH